MFLLELFFKTLTLDRKVVYMKILKHRPEFFSQQYADFEIPIDIDQISITEDNYGNIKIYDYQALSEITCTDIVKPRKQVIENNIVYMDQFL